MKKFFSAALILNMFFLPCVIADDSSLPSVPRDLKLQKITEESNRNKELLEIWKDHVRTLTKERDEAYKQLESLKTSLPQSSLTPVSGNAAHFGQIETQPLPIANAAVINAPAPVYEPSVPQTSADVRGYQDTIKELRRQIDEIHARDQRMQKEIMEAGNDKTLIIKDKEQAIAKIEALTKQVSSLKGENDNLAQRLRAAAPASSAESAAQGQESPSFLQNSYKLQSEKLKQAEQEKSNIIMKSAELQKKYVDLQSAYEKLSAERSLNAAASGEQSFEDAGNLKSENARLAADLEKTRNEMEKLVREKKDADNNLKNLKAQYESKLADNDTRKQTKKSNITEIYASKDAQDTAARIASLAKNMEALQFENNALRSKLNKLKQDSEGGRNGGAEAEQKSAQFSQMQSENNVLRSQINAAKASENEVKAQSELDKAKIAELESRIENIKARENASGDYSAERENLLQKIEELKSQNMALQGNISKLSESEVRNKAISAKAARADELQAANDRMKAELEKMRPQGTNTASEAAQIKSKALAIESENKFLKTKMESDLAQFKAQRDELKKVLEASQITASAIREENRNLTQTISKLQAENQSLRTQPSGSTDNDMEKKYLQSVSSDLTYKMKRREIALDQALKRIQTMKAEREKILAEKAQYESSRSASDAEKDATLSKARLAESEIENSRQQIAALRAELESTKLLNRQLKAEKEKISTDQQLYQSTSSAKQAEYEANESKIRLLESEKEASAKLTASLRSDLASAAEQIRQMKSEKEKIASDRQEFQASAASLKAESEADKASLSRYENQVASLRSDLDAANEQIRKMNAEKDKITSDQQAYQTSAATLKTENSANKLKISQLESQVETLRADLETTSEQNRQMISEKSKFVSDQWQKQAAMASLTSENESLKSRLDAAASQNKQISADNAKYISEQQLKQSTLTSLQAENEAMKARLEAADELNKKTAAENAKFVTEQQTKQAALTSLQAENEEIKSRLDTLSSQNKQLAAENEKLAAAQQQDQSSLAALKSENESMKARMSQTESASETYKNQASELHSDLDIANDLNKKMKERYAALGQQVDALRVSVVASQAEKEKLAALRLEYDRLNSESQRNREEAERKSQALKSRIDALELQKQKDEAVRVEKEKLSAENETMKKAMVDVERESQQNEEKLNSLKAEASDLRESNEQLRKTQDEQLKTIDDLKADLKKSLDDIQNLKSNFQAYLESLVTSFEERQAGGKKPLPAPPQ